MNAVNAVTV